ncbi:MAG: UvrD-helicase domain-containing protein [Flavobacteriales bacterium]
MSEGHFKVLRASAGSGKTYALVSEYITMALGNARADYYRHILAITFTNAAAAEMKERVLKLLRKISEFHPDAEILGQSLSTKLQIDRAELGRRAAGTYRHMLHHYGLLSVSTIDSFTHRLVRSFSRDLHIAHDFNVQLDADEFKEAITDACLNLIGEDEALTAYFRQFTFDQLAEEKSWNPRDAILEISAQLLKEDATHALEKLQDFHLADFTLVRKNLQAKQSVYKNRLAELANLSIELFEKRGLAAGDFANGGRGNISFLYKLQKGEIDKPSDTFYKTVNTGNWQKKGLPADKSDAISSLENELTGYCKQIIDLVEDKLLIEFHLRNAILAKINSIGLLHELNNLSERYKQEENILLIKDFHELIGKIVQENDAPFIYERIGHRYRHILIDEFQDTSAKQWSNMVPLIVNALGENNLNLLVGDAKQSIYRWRGGKAEQFVNLPEIEITGVHRFAGEAFRLQFLAENLLFNYRSGKSIIAFNNELYKQISALFPFSEKIYSEHAQQTIRELDGLVEVIKTSSPDKSERWEQTSSAILGSIKKSLDAGYRPGDIAVLTRKGRKEGGLIAQLLTEHGYQVATLESMLIQNSPIVQALTGYFGYLLDKKNHFAIIQTVRGLSIVHAHLDFSEFLTKQVKHENKLLHIDFENWLAKHFDSIFDPPGIGDPLSIATSLLAYFRFETDEFVEFYLELIRKRNATGNNSLMQWIDWWNKNQHRQYISTSPDPQSIRIMTIHKSKGLQFPVVIYPRFASGTQSNDLWIDLDSEEYGLPAALVRPNAKFSDAIPELAMEKNKQILDDLNLCYVATTRAEDCLFVIAEEGRSSTEFTKLFSQALIAGFDAYKTDEQQWAIGKLPSSITHSAVEKTTPISHSYKQNTTPAFRSAIFEEEDDQPESYGRMLHEILASIANSEITSDQLDHLIIAKTNELSLRKRLLHDALAVLDKSKDFGWFEKGHTLFCEREILSNDGRLFRPDRVVVRDVFIDLIDYKTGVMREEHKKQLEEYALLLKEIYSKEVRSFLVYVQQDVQIVPLNG